MRRDIRKLNLFCGNDIFQKKPEYKKIERLRLAPNRKPFFSAALLEYIPKLTDPVKIVCCNLHIFQKANGEGNYLESELPRLRQIMNWTNDRYQFPMPQSDTYPPATVLTDTRIRFKVNRIEFYKDQALYTSGSVSALQAAAVARNPDCLDQLNIYINNGGYIPPGGTTSAAGIAVMPSTSLSFNSWVVLFGGAPPQTSPNWMDADYGRSGTLSHELGHVLDLPHTYNGGGAPAACTIGPDFLGDVFGVNPATCPHVCAWAPDPTIQEPLVPNSLITNNLMGGNHMNYWVSGLQAATMHRALTEKSVKRYVADGCDDCASCVAFTVHGVNHVSQGGDALLVYGQVLLNEAWGWVGESTFVTPVAGIYHFDASFVKNAFGGEGTEGDVLMTILKNGEFVGRAWSGNGSGKRGTGCVALNARLDRGDVITTVAQSVDGAKRNYLEYYFSGHRVCGCC